MGSTGVARLSLAHPSIPVRSGAVQGTRAAPAPGIMLFLGMSWAHTRTHGQTHLGLHDQAGELEISPAVILVGQGPAGPGGWCGVLARGSVQGNPGGWAGTVRLSVPQGPNTCMHWSVQRQAGFIWLLLCCQPCPGLSCSGQSLTCMPSVNALPPRGLGFHHWCFFAKHTPLNPVQLCNLSIIWAWEHPSQLSRYRFKYSWKETWLSYLLASRLPFSQVANPWPTTLLMKTPCSTSRGVRGPELPGAVSHCMMVCSCFWWLCCGWFNIHEGTPHGELRLTTLHNCCLWTK